MRYQERHRSGCSGWLSPLITTKPSRNQWRLPSTTKRAEEKTSFLNDELTKTSLLTFGDRPAAKWTLICVRLVVSPLHLFYCFVFLLRQNLQCCFSKYGVCETPEGGFKCYYNLKGEVPDLFESVFNIWCVPVQVRGLWWQKLLSLMTPSAPVYLQFRFIILGLITTNLITSFSQRWDWLLWA